jgi:DNA polymerase-3 subunit delta'
MARAHPDLLVLERESPDGKPRRVIPVDEARALPEFFSKSPATAAYRVAIIDAADDLNVNAANAVLKTLEEPPPRGVLFLVSHAPGGLLPTIRSRCRRLAFHQRLREGFLAIARAEPERCAVIDAQGGVEEVESLVWAAVEARLKVHG